MDDYIILADSTADLTPELIEELGIEVLPMDFILDEKTYSHYPDAREFDQKDFYKALRDDKTAKTVQINMALFTEYFEHYLKQGKDIIYICFSSALSGTFNSACIAAKELENTYKDNKVIVVDSRAASMGEGLLIFNAVEQKKNGLSIDELASWVTKNRDNLCHWFTVDDLFHLKKGGRISSTAAVLGSMLNIKPVLHVDEEGRLIPLDKIRGRKQSLQTLVKHMEDTAIDPQNQVIFVSHGDSEEDCKFVVDLVKEKFNPKRIVTNYIGPIIGTHSGPGTIALFFIGTEK